MADKTTKELERIYTIPLRELKSSPRNHRSDRAVRAVKTYLTKHMKAGSVWIDTSVNEKLWDRGMYRIPSKIRVRALKFDDGVVEVTLPEADVTTSLRADLKKRREKDSEAKAKKEEKKEKAEAEKKEGESKEEKASEEKPEPKKEAPAKPEKKDAPAKAAEKKEHAHKEGEHKPAAKAEKHEPKEPKSAAHPKKE